MSEYSIGKFNSPAFRNSLSRYGNPDEILYRAEYELQHKVLFSRDDLVVTPRYLFEFKSWRVNVIPLESVLWVFDMQDYKYSMKDKRERMHFSLRITTITGDSFSLRDYPKASLDAILSILTDRYPNFFYGYSTEHEKMVNYILRENRRELSEKRKKKSGEHLD